MTGHRVRICLLTVAALLLTACSSSPGSDAEEAQPDVDDTALANAVEIQAFGCKPQPVRGAGSFIDGGFILTAAHVVSGAGSITVRLASSAGSDPLQAHLVAIEPADDLALLAVAAHVPAGLPLGHASGSDTGVAVVFRDHVPIAEPFVISRAVMVRISDIYHHGTVDRSGYQVAIEIEPGDSGAVLVGSTGAAEGVLYAKSQATENRAWATALGAVPRLVARANDVDPDAGIDPGQCAG